MNNGIFFLIFLVCLSQLDNVKKIPSFFWWLTWRLWKLPAGWWRCFILRNVLNFKKAKSLITPETTWSNIYNKYYAVFLASTLVLAIYLFDRIKARRNCSCSVLYDYDEIKVFYNYCAKGYSTPTISFF